MIVRNTTEAAVRQALFEINSGRYEDMIIFTDGINVKRARKNGNFDLRLGLRTKAGKCYGSRVSWSGRRGPYACWHVYKYFFSELFHIDPTCVAVTAMAKYTKENFEETYPETYYTNAGLMMSPVFFGDLCFSC